MRASRLQALLYIYCFGYTRVQKFLWPPNGTQGTCQVQKAASVVLHTLFKMRSMLLHRL